MVNSRTGDFFLNAIRYDTPKISIRPDISYLDTNRDTIRYIASRYDTIRYIVSIFRYVTIYRIVSYLDTIRYFDTIRLPYRIDIFRKYRYDISYRIASPTVDI